MKRRKAIIARLHRYGGECRFNGLAWALEISNTSLAEELRELEAAGVLTWRKGHVHLLQGAAS